MRGGGKDLAHCRRKPLPAGGILGYNSNIPAKSVSRACKGENRDI